MNKKSKNDLKKLTGTYYTNAITDNKKTDNGEIINAHKANAVYARETSENIKL